MLLGFSTRTIIGSRAFSVAAPTVWNSLPDNVVNADTLTVFKKQLKSHLFTAFNWTLNHSQPAHERLCRPIMALYKFYLYCIVLYCIIMKISQEDAILIKKISICQRSMLKVYEGCWMNYPTRIGNLEASTVCWRESARQVQLSGNQAAVDRVRCVAVEDLVLNQEDKPKRHRSARRISCVNSHSPFKCAQDRLIHHNIQLKLQTPV